MGCVSVIKSNKYKKMARLIDLSALKYNLTNK